MPELYAGQTEIAEGRLAEMQLHQRADEEQLNATTDPAERAAILSRMAQRQGSITSQQRFVLQLRDELPEEDRTETIRVRLTPTERVRLDEAARQEGLTLSQFVRKRCEL